MNRLKCNRLLRWREERRGALEWNWPHSSECNAKRIMRRKKWEYITIQWPNCGKLSFCGPAAWKKKQQPRVWMPIYEWETTRCLPACVRVPLVCDSFPPSMLIKTVCVRLQKENTVCSSAYRHVKVCTGNYILFYMCIKYVWVWVGAGLCKYWCIVVRKAITNSGPRASLYWKSEGKRERERGGHAQKTHTQTETTSNSVNTITQTHNLRQMQMRCQQRKEGKVDSGVFTMRTHTGVQQHSAVIYRGAISFQNAAPLFCC